MTGEAKRSTVTRTFVVEQPIESIWETLVDPQAPMWLTPKAAYSVAPPEPVEGVGELRCCWVHQWKKGIRQQTVWELLRVEPGHHLTYVSRTGPVQARIDFRLASQAPGTRVELSFHKQSPLKDRLLGHHLRGGGAEDLMTRLIATTADDPVMPISPQVMTWAPGIGARKQVNEIVISAPPKLVWTIADDKDDTHLSHPLRLGPWRSVVDGVEYRYSVTHLPGTGLVAGMARIIPDGRYRTTTVGVDGTEVAHELLPHDNACLLRTTTRWTALIKAKRIRAGAQAWLAQVKAVAERPAS